MGLRWTPCPLTCSLSSFVQPRDLGCCWCHPEKQVSMVQLQTLKPVEGGERRQLWGKAFLQCPWKQLVPRHCLQARPVGQTPQDEGVRSPLVLQLSLQIRTTVVVGIY